MRQFEGTHGYPMGSPLIWQDNTTGNIYMSDNNFYYYVQDHYSLGTVETSTKIAEIESCIEKAHAEPYPYRCFYINFTSGERQTSEPLVSIASDIQPSIDNYLQSKRYPDVGVIMMNFAGGSDDGNVHTGFVETVINLNNFSDSLRIGSQTWMNHNLRVSKYSNGDVIPHVQDPVEWSKLTTGAWCYYDNDSTHGVFDGKLYNWYAVHDPRGLAPEGWHVASDNDWNTLADFLGGWQVAGGKLKDAGYLHWSQPNTGGMNNVLFTATPAGMRNGDGSFTGVNATAYWWSSSQDYPKVIQCNDPGLWNSNGATPKQAGLPVRCVKNN